MPATTADAVIVGGGVNGASAAFQLMRRGAGRVVLLERHYLGAGASGKSGALVRMHYTNEAESRLAFESMKIFQHWGEIVGGSCGLETPGFAQLVAPEYEEALRANVAAQQALGIDTRVISARELHELAPVVNVDDLTYVAYEQGSGYADPLATTYGFARRAQELGAELREHAPVTTIDTRSGRVRGVTLASGDQIAAPVVLVVAGTGASALLAPLGIDLGLTPYRSQVVIFRWPPSVTAHPVLIDRALGAWLRPEGSGTLIGAEQGSGPTEDPVGDETIGASYVEVARRTLAHRIPALRDAPMRGGWAGTYTMSPDGRPVVDRFDDPEGLFVMAGDSGTSFKTAPALGQCLAEWIVDGQPRLVDLAPFSASRIAEGRLWNDRHTYGQRGPVTISR